MNWQHIKTIVWLRWRLGLNGFRRAGKLSAVIGVIFVFAGLVTAACSFFIATVVGIVALPEANADHVLIMWDVVILAFLFCWLIGLITELQQSELLSLDKLLHMPVSLFGAFVLNYLSSWVSLTMAVFLPAMLGLCIASVVVFGPKMLLLVPLVLGFVLLVTAVTYQLRAWLVTIMVNKRKRRAIVTGVTIAIIALSQMPNVINLVVFRGMRDRTSAEYNAKTQELARKLGAGEINAEEHQRLQKELGEQRKDERAQRTANIYNTGVRYTRMANIALPIGWLPYGAHTAAQGSLWPGLLCASGMLLLAAASLRRSYRNTIRFFTGAAADQVDVRKAKVRSKEAQPSNVSYPVFMERKLPWCSEQVSALACATFRSLVRAPEFKMALLFPLFMMGAFVVFGFLGPVNEIADYVRPFIVIGAMVSTMFGVLQLMMNMFGFDRDAFRALILTPMPRSNILMAKNVALLPLALAICGGLMCILQFAMPIPPSHVLATAIQFVAFFVLCSLLGNTTSILAPVAMVGGTMKAAKFSVVAVLVHSLAMVFFPVLVIPAALAIGLELLLQHYFEVAGFPIYLSISVIEAGVIVWIYRPMLEILGRMLHRREQRILEVVTATTQ